MHSGRMHVDTLVCAQVSASEPASTALLAVSHPKDPRPAALIRLAFGNAAGLGKPFSINAFALILAGKQSQFVAALISSPKGYGRLAARPWRI